MTQQEHLITILIDELKEFRKKGPSKQHLLDDFAKAAMQGVITYHGQNAGTYDHLAKISYDIAEAMMQEQGRRMKG